MPDELQVQPMLRPRPGVSTMHDKAEAVLAVEIARVGHDARAYAVFHLKMPDAFGLVGIDRNSVAVAVPLDDCELG